MLIVHGGIRGHREKRIEPTVSKNLDAAGSLARA
jgi:hypothetical protein